MKISRSFCLLSVALCTLLSFGCATTDTVDSRIKGKSDLYAGLTPEEQRQIHDGRIGIGFSPDMVFMSLGKPEQVIPGSGPGEESWIYHNYYGPNGSSNQMGATVKTSIPGQEVGGGGSPLGPKAAPISNPRGYTNTFQVEYDSMHTDINAKDDTSIKVVVKFTEGTVADIQIVHDGH